MIHAKYPFGRELLTIGIGKKLGAFAKPQTPGSHCDEFVVTAAFPSIFLYIKYI